MTMAAVQKKLTIAKKRLAEVYERKGITDHEVLRIGREVDKLVNYLSRDHKLPRTNTKKNGPSLG